MTTHEVPPPLVSIVLVTRNGAETLPALIGALSRQRVDFGFEVIAVDSGSTDGSAELLARSVDRFVSIDPAAFNHGSTRNLAIEHATGELVVLLVQDALPADDSWLAELTRPLRADRDLAGTFARQRPRPAASAIGRYYMERAIAAQPAARSIPPLTEQDLAALEPIERLRRCTFDNVCSCIRRSVWCRIPFRRTPIAEDLEWAKEVLLTGFRLEYAPSAVVVHSHDRSAAYELARTYRLHQRLVELFELRTIPTVPLLVRAVASSLVLHLRCERTRPGAWARAIALAVAWPLGQYLGGSTAAKGPEAKKAGRTAAALKK
jgi:rhamnosyltransferase